MTKIGKENFISDDGILALAMAGAGLTALGVALGAAEVAEDLIDIVDEATGKVSSIPKKVASFLGFGRKGGLF